MAFSRHGPVTVSRVTVSGHGVTSHCDESGAGRAAGTGQKQARRPCEKMAESKSTVEQTAEDAKGPTQGHTDLYIYVVGGRDRGRTLGVCERFSLIKQEWERCPLLNEPRGSHGAASIGGVVFAVGGGGLRSNLATVEAFDAIDGTLTPWRHVSSMTTPRHALSVTAAEGHIFAVGGWMNGNCCAEEVERYDPCKDSWTTCKPLITARKLHGLAAKEGRLFVFGGAGHDESLIKSAEFYDIKQDEWSPLPDLPIEAYASAADAGQHIYVFLWGKFVVRFDMVGRRYERLGPLPLPEWFGFATVGVGGVIYAMGGQSKGRRMGIAYRYEPADDSWHALPPMRMVRRRCAAAVCRHVAPAPAAAAAAGGVAGAGAAEPTSPAAAAAET